MHELRLRADGLVSRHAGGRSRTESGSLVVEAVVVVEAVLSLGP